MASLNQVINAIRCVLPAPTYKVIAERVSVHLGEQIGMDSISSAMAHLRKNCDAYQWTIPHSERGQNTYMADRYFVQLLNHDGTSIIDPKALIQIKWGFQATIRHTVTMSQNEVKALTATIQCIESRSQRNMVEELTEDFRYVSRKAAAILKGFWKQDEEDVA